ncbi:hypothetical protein HD806DRAFT_532512 [Xylariaceae sp. AK1471]|nr:hypothetical protein HD806DRAFT_532512 [Xylariaceae sp. AK1471]
MENLCKGIPQRVHDGAVLIAITSELLYPDVDVFGRRAECVVQNNLLVSSIGRLTVGLEDAEPESAISVPWSLSLANLRFYGDPVLAATHVRDASRVADQEKGAKLFVALWKSLECIVSDTSTNTPKG